MKNQIKPFVKWVGGKTQFKEIIFDLMPNKKDIKRFIEPFVGGGSIFLSLKHNNTIINDLNGELITAYRVLQNEGQERERERETLIELLNKYDQSHSKDFYLKIRKLELSQLSDVEIAARFIYLNKAGFNGMYRVNKSGLFNVPFGQKEKVNTYDEENIENIKKYLSRKTIKIMNDDYMNILDKAREGDFIFVDPPYHETFTDYTAGGFEEKQQKLLADKLNSLTSKGIKWILCNNPTPLIKNLYKNNQHWVVSANRMINSDSSKRTSSAKEIFVTNYITDSIKDKKSYVELHDFFKTIKPTNRSLSQLVDWKKVNRNVLEHQYNLNKLNVFLRCNTQKEVKEKIDFIFENNDEKAFESLKLLVAKRHVFEEEYLVEDKTKTFRYNIKKDVIEFIKESNLINLFKTVNNLIDYVYGVEVGLDSNARKNRSGSLFENTIKGILNERGIQPQEQVKVEGIKKKFDFAFEKNGKLHLVETNFYNGGGSKINEVLKSYIELQRQVKDKGYEFLWITDGKGITTIKKQLLENWNKVNVFNTTQFLRELDK